MENQVEKNLGNEMGARIMQDAQPKREGSSNSWALFRFPLYFGLYFGRYHIIYSPSTGTTILIT